MEKQDFIPATSPREIGNGVFFQPIRSWHSGTYAGEKIIEIDGDASGCMYRNKPDHPHLNSCPIPLSVTHRLYWHERNPSVTISAFLSYPSGLGADPNYFWEAYFGDTERFSSEHEMEMAIRVFFNSKQE